MPLITVWNQAYGHDHALGVALREACFSVKALSLEKPEDVVVCTGSTDDAGSRAPVIIIVELLFDKPERTQEVRKQLAEALGEAARRFYQSEEMRITNKPIEVFVKRFNPDKDAFWTGKS